MEACRDVVYCVRVHRLKGLSYLHVALFPDCPPRTLLTFELAHNKIWAAIFLANEFKGQALVMTQGGSLGTRLIYMYSLSLYTVCVGVEQPAAS